MKKNLLNLKILLFLFIITLFISMDDSVSSDDIENGGKEIAAIWIDIGREIQGKKSLIVNKGILSAAQFYILNTIINEVTVDSKNGPVKDIHGNDENAVVRETINGGMKIYFDSIWFAEELKKSNEKPYRIVAHEYLRVLEHRLRKEFSNYDFNDDTYFYSTQIADLMNYNHQIVKSGVISTCQLEGKLKKRWVMTMSSNGASFKIPFLSPSKDNDDYCFVEKDAFDLTKSFPKRICGCSDSPFTNRKIYLNCLEISSAGEIKQTISNMEFQNYNPNVALEDCFNGANDHIDPILNDASRMQSSKGRTIEVPVFGFDSSFLQKVNYFLGSTIRGNFYSQDAHTVSTRQEIFCRNKNRLMKDDKIRLYNFDGSLKGDFYFDNLDSCIYTMEKIKMATFENPYYLKINLDYGTVENIYR